MWENAADLAVAARVRHRIPVHGLRTRRRDSDDAHRLSEIRHFHQTGRLVGFCR